MSDVVAMNQKKNKQDTNICVLASGAGTNFLAITNYFKNNPSVRISGVICNRPAAGVLALAHQLGVPSVVVDHRDYSDRMQFEQKLVEQILSIWNTYTVILAGFDRVLSSFFINQFFDSHRNCSSVLNIHPSYLPAFPGLGAIQQAKDYGACGVGITVHIVDSGVDSGPILSQSWVPCSGHESLVEWEQRVHAEEHRLYPKTIARWLASGGHVEGRKFIWENE